MMQLVVQHQQTSSIISATLLNSVSTAEKYLGKHHKQKLITFTMNINNQAARVLIDAGAEGNFIDMTFAAKHTFTFNTVSSNIKVDMANSTSRSITQSVDA